MDKSIMDVKEAAQYIGVSATTLYGLAQQKQCPAVKVGGQWRFHKHALDSWIVTKSNENLNSNE